MGLSAALLAGGALALALGTGGGQLPAGTTIAGVAVGGLDQAGALARLRASQGAPGQATQAARGQVVLPPTELSPTGPLPTELLPTDRPPLAEPQITVSAAGHRWIVPASTLGWSSDLEASVQNAVNDLGNGVIKRLQELVGVGAASTYPLVQQIDSGAASAGLNRLTAQLSSAPRDARIVFDKSRYTALPGQPGLRANTAAAVAELVADPTLRALTIETEQRAPGFTAAQAQALAQQGNALARPVTITLTGSGTPPRSARLTPLQVANLYWVRPSGIVPDDAAIRLKLAQVQEALDQPAQNARFRVVGGTLQKAGERAGMVTDPAELKTVLETIARDSNRGDFRVSGRTQQPTLTLADLPKLSDLKLISSGVSTYYHSSAARRTNVANAASKISGMVVPAGETFSFLGTLGSITPGNGFVTGLIISAGRTVDGLGGGVCQVSTTTFRAMYQAGLPVVERNQHAYRVGYYEPRVGFEAAVYDPGVDLKMKNDTGGPIYIEAINDNARSTLTVKLWGQAQTRSVSVSPATILSRTPHPAARYVPTSRLPRGATNQIDWAADGYSLYITRTIRDGAKVTTDKVSTAYKPWQAVYEVGQ